MKSEARLERLREGGISVDEFIDKFVYTYEAEEKAEERAQEEARLQRQRSMKAAAEGDWGSSGSEGGERQQVAQVEQQPQVRMQGWAGRQAARSSMPKRPPYLASIIHCQKSKSNLAQDADYYQQQQQDANGGWAVNDGWGNEEEPHAEAGVAAVAETQDGEQGNWASWDNQPQQEQPQAAAEQEPIHCCHEFRRLFRSTDSNFNARLVWKLGPKQKICIEGRLSLKY